MGMTVGGDSDRIGLTATHKYNEPTSAHRRQDLKVTSDYLIAAQQKPRRRRKTKPAADSATTVSENAFRRVLTVASTWLRGADAAPEPGQQEGGLVGKTNATPLNDWNADEHQDYGHWREFTICWV